MKTPIVPVTCWNCETEYDHMKHEVCPVCDRHWADVRKDDPPQSGTRVSVKIDYSKRRIKALPVLLFIVGLILVSCASRKPYCPTYAFVAPIEEQPRVRVIDTAWVDSKRYYLYEKQDTTHVPQRRYPFLEKVAVVGALYLVVVMVKAQTE